MKRRTGQAEWRKWLKADPTDWLVGEDNPPVRYRTLRQIAGLPETDAQVRAARQAIVTYAPVQQTLRRLEEVLRVEPVDMAILATAGLTREEPTIERLCQSVLDGQQSRIRSQGGWGCYIGQAVGGLIRMGFGKDKRIKPMIQAIVREQRFYDGNRPGTHLRYGPPNTLCAGSHTCFSAAGWSLWALSAIPPRLRTAGVKDFLHRGADFLRAHHIYRMNHHAMKPVRSAWLKLQSPMSLGWRVDVLQLLEVATQVGLANDPAARDAVQFVLDKQGLDGRWVLEARHKDRARARKPLWESEQEGQPSKWVTLAAITQLKRCEKLLRTMKTAARSAASKTPGKSMPKPKASSAPTRREYAAYPFPCDAEDEQHVRAKWAAARLLPMLERLLRFAVEHGLQAGWHRGLVLGPKWCREWCAAEAKWVPYIHYPQAYPVCRLFFLARRGLFDTGALAEQLGMPLEDEQEKRAFDRRFRANFWRVRRAPWKDEHDEIALTLRREVELEPALHVMGEAFESLG
ncbi:MAG TPA: hypothetical protein VMZ31_19760 [Phycisphaerae bacterium]|nr:hypothetical protein [Phycisphaerae bacterium]